MLRPVLPLATYYANYDYITTELCENRNKPILQCNGTCYVEELMSDANLLVGDDTSKPINILIYFPIFIMEKFNYEVKTISAFENFDTPNFSKSLKINRYINSIFRPPRA